MRSDPNKTVLADLTKVAVAAGLPLAAAIAIAILPFRLSVFASLATVVTIAGIGAIRRPRYLIYLVLFLAAVASPIRSLDQLSLGNTNITLSGIQWVAVASAAVVILLFRLPSVRLPAVYVWLLVFAAWIQLRFLLAGMDLRGAKDVLFYTLPAIIFLAARTALLEDGINTAKRFELLLLGLVLVPLTLYSIAVPLGWIQLTANGPQGLFGPRPIATLLALILGVALARHRYGPTHRRLALTVALASLGLILFSASRTALASAVLVALLSRVNAARMWRVAPRIALAVPLVLTILLSVPTLRQRMFHGDPTDLRSAVQTINMSGREIMWEAAFDHALQRPLIGWGPGSARPIVAEALDFRFGEEYPPHNDYLQVFHDAGIIGLLLLLVAWFSLLRLHLKNWQRADASGDIETARWNLSAALVLVAMLINAFLDNTLHYPFVTAPICVVLACAHASPIFSKQGTAAR